MTKYEFSITVPASGVANRVNLAVAAFAAANQDAVPINCSNLFTSKYLPSCRLSFYMGKGSIGMGFLGGPTVDDTGADAAYTAVPGNPTSIAGPLASIDISPSGNAICLEQFNAHGTNPGDVIRIVYYQE